VQAELAGAVLSGIIERGDEDRVRFSHALLRECLYDMLEPRARAKLHPRADALTEAGMVAPGQLDSVARHLLLAPPEGDIERAIDQARAAARSCLHDLSFERAIELLDGVRTAVPGFAGGQPGCREVRPTFGDGFVQGLTARRR
jgi:hypothetical protein